MRFLLMTFALAWPVFAHAQVVREMTPAQIAEAIQAGERGRVSDGRMITTVNWAVAGALQVATFSTPFMRVAAAAAKAKREYGLFRPDDVTPEMIAPELHIYAWAQGELPNVSNVQAVVITPRKGNDAQKRADAIHPARFEDIPTVFRNAFGATGEATGKMAVFPLELLSEDREVHIVYDSAATIARTRSGDIGCTDCKTTFRLKNVR